MEDEYLALAEEYGVDIEGHSQLVQSEASLYTKYQEPDKVRRVVDLHKTDTFKWTVPGEKSDYIEGLFYKTPDGSVVEFATIHELVGIVVNYQQRDELGYWDGEKSVKLCSVIGYTPRDKEGNLLTPVKTLPEVPYASKYNWDKSEDGTSFINHTSPHEKVGKLGLIGMRGGRPIRCEECIFNGMSHDKRIDASGEVKPFDCEAKGKLHLAVFEVSKFKLTPSKVKGGEPTIEKTTKKISELCYESGEEIGNCLLIQVPMSKSSIQGKYVADNPDQCIDGYSRYVTNLGKIHKGNNALSHPLFNLTSLTLKKNPKSPTYQCHFSSLDKAPVDYIKEAKKVWAIEAPIQNVTSLSISGFHPPALKSASPSHYEEIPMDEDIEEYVEVDSTSTLNLGKELPF